MIYTEPVTAPLPAESGGPERTARQAVLDAARLLVEGGLGAATVEAVAAGRVSKVTIYKWWPSRGSVAVDAYFHRYGRPARSRTPGPGRRPHGQIRLLIEAFRGRAGPVMAS